jgi:adenylate cyclase
MATESSGVVESSSTLPLRSALLTFLIADVRGYTSFTVEQGNEAAARLASTFAGIARGVVAGRDGEVIELRGDEALAVFPSARSALYAAVELQARFREHMEVDPALPLRVGIGVDAGEAVPVEGGYRGLALNLAARLCSLAGPGEVGLLAQKDGTMKAAVEGP